MEYENAIKRDLPVYILVEKNVYAEFETFKRNRDNETIKYAHVDSVNIFYFIEKIVNQPRNNPVYQFERHLDIESWLRTQWAGLFQELIRRRKTESEILELSKEVKELSNINTTLKRYLEEIVTKTDKVKGAALIEEEENRLSTSRMMNRFVKHHYVKELVDGYDFTVEQLKDLITNAKSFEELASDYAKVTKNTTAIEFLNHWKENKFVQEGLNELKKILGLKPFAPLN